MKSIYDLNPATSNLLALDYNYQHDLTIKLDNTNSDFDQDIINEIVLWKVNRYAKLDNEVIMLVNQISKNSRIVDADLTKNILEKLLDTKGIRLPMASTILRFRNPNIYQIIDQRVYRVIYGHQLKLSTSIKKNIGLYLNYLLKLKETSNIYKIPFSKSDRILYEYDKSVNPEPIRY